MSSFGNEAKLILEPQQPESGEATIPTIQATDSYKSSKMKILPTTPVKT